VSVEAVGQKRLHHLQVPYREPGPTGSTPGPGPGIDTGSHRVPHPVGVDSERDPGRTTARNGQPGPAEAQAELDRLRAKGFV
jgi:hypothetical protein